MGNSSVCPTINVDVSLRKIIPQLDNAELRVLLSLGLRVNGERAAWPSMAKIAEDTGLTRRSVQYAINKLEKASLIQVQRHIENNRRRNSYHVNHYFQWGHDGCTTKPIVTQPQHKENIVQTVCSVQTELSPKANGSYVQAVQLQPQLQGAENSGQGRIDNSLLQDTTYPVTEPSVTTKDTENKDLKLDTVGKRKEWISCQNNKNAALYFVACQLLPAASLPRPGGGAKCPGIGRLGRMAQVYGGWAVVHLQLEYAAIDLQLGRAAAGDILSWVEGRLKAITYSRRSTGFSSRSSVFTSTSKPRYLSPERAKELGVETFPDDEVLQTVGEASR